MIEPKHTFESVVRELRKGLQTGTVVLDRSEGAKEIMRAGRPQACERRTRLQSGFEATRRGTCIFISYSRRDARFLERLRVHMRPLEKAQRVELWDDTRIKAGQQWRSEIDRALKHAKAAVLLISADFLASDFAADDEVPLLLEKAESEGRPPASRETRA